MTEKNTWGGKRPGAGRKPFPSAKRKMSYSMKLRHDQIEWLRNQKIPATRLLENLIDAAMEAQGDYQSIEKK